MEGWKGLVDGWPAATAAAATLLLPLEPAVGEMRSWHCSSTCRKGMDAYRDRRLSLTQNKIIKSKKEKPKNGVVEKRS